MSSDISYNIDSLIIRFFSDGHNNKKQIIELAEEGINISFGIAYDAFIHLRKLSVAVWALQTLKYFYQYGLEEGITKIVDKVNKTYVELGYTLKRPERNDLGDAIELVELYKNDLKTKGLFFPKEMSTSLYNRIDKEEKNKTQKN